MDIVRVESHQITMTEDYEYLYAGEPFTGTGFKIYKDLILHETNYVMGAKSGLARRWYPESTQLYYELFYRNNSLHGMQKYWYAYGQRKSFQIMDSGILVKGVVWNQSCEVVGVYRISERDWTLRLLSKGNQLTDCLNSRPDQTEEEQEIEKAMRENSHLIGYWPLD